jgi:GAF domain-containing protein
MLGLQIGEPPFMSDLRTHATNTLIDALQGTLTPGERFQRTLHIACEVLATEIGILAPCRTRYPDLSAIPYGFTLEEWQTPRFAFTRALVFQTFQNPVATLTSDAQPDFHHDIARSIGLHSILCVPLLDEVPPHAILCLQRRLTTAPFTPDDLDLLETLARITTQALNLVDS